MEYRTAEKTDCKAIEKLFQEMLAGIGMDSEIKGYDPGYLDHFFHGEDRIFLAQSNDQIIGFISVEIHQDEKPSAYIDDFCVTAEYRNRGIGTELLTLAEQYAEDCGCAAKVLHVLKTNTAAMRFYERNGYTVMREEALRFLLCKDQNS